MNMSRSSAQQPRLVLGKVLKAAAFGLVGATIFGLAMVTGYQTENQASR